MRVLGCYPREATTSLVRTRGESGLRSLLNSSSILANALPVAVNRPAPPPPQANEHAPLPSLNGYAPMQARLRRRAQLFRQPGPLSSVFPMRGRYLKSVCRKSQGKGL